jgi:hypothetical protein
MNPGTRSPQKLRRDPAYVYVTERAVLVLARDQHIQHVVQHLPSGTYWACVYAMRMDDSDFDEPGQWRQVYPKQVTVYEDAP